MAQRIIGLDITEKEARVAILEVGLRRYKIVDCFRYAVESAVEEQAGQMTKNLKDIIKSEIAPLIMPGDTVVTAFPGEKIMQRELLFPFRQREKIEGALGFQLIGFVPAGIEDIVYDYQVIEKTHEGVRLLAVAAMIKDMENYLASLRDCGIEPRIITCDSLCYHSLSDYLDEENSLCILMSDTAKKEMCLLRNNNIESFRTFNAKPEEFSSDMKATFFSWITEHGEFPEKIYLATKDGQDNQTEIANLMNDLSQGEGAKIERFPVSKIRVEGLEFITRQDDLRMIKPLALAMRGLAPASGDLLNLRKGHLSYGGDIELFKSKFKIIGAFIAIAIVILGVRFYFKYDSLNIERQGLVSQLKQHSKNVLGTEKDDFDAVLKLLKTTPREELEIFPKWTAVSTLIKINRAAEKTKASGRLEGTMVEKKPAEHPEAIPIYMPSEDSMIELENIRIEPRSAFIKGETNTIDTLESFLSSLRSESCFAQVMTESTERIAFQRHSGWQKFTIKITIECAEKTPAKGTESEKGEKPKTENSGI
jgi:Tfp pilus assembly PilM family ATPase